MAVANAPAYDNMAKITAVIRLIVKALSLSLTLKKYFFEKTG
jgi:hypothetical protein